MKLIRRTGDLATDQSNHVPIQTRQSYWPCTCKSAPQKIGSRQVKVTDRNKRQPKWLSKVTTQTYKTELVQKRYNCNYKQRNTNTRHNSPISTVKQTQSYKTSTTPPHPTPYPNHLHQCQYRIYHILFSKPDTTSISQYLISVSKSDTISTSQYLHNSKLHLHTTVSQQHPAYNIQHNNIISKQ